MSSLFNDTENDLPLRSRVPGEMRTDAEVRGGGRKAGNDREFTLNTGTVLGIFLALALLCVCVFGFGYSMGRKSAQPAVATAASGDADASPPASSGAKPPSGSPVSEPVPGYLGNTTAAADGGANRPKQAESVDAESAAPVSRPVVPPAVVVASPEKAATAKVETTTAAAPAAKTVPAPVVRVPPAVAAQPPVTAPAAAAVAFPAAGGTYVQIVAVSHQEDANVVMAALRRRGYNVVQRSTSADPLIHVQVGPFASRKDAEAMKQRLSGDGYNAILK